MMTEATVTSQKLEKLKTMLNFVADDLAQAKERFDKKIENGDMAEAYYQDLAVLTALDRRAALVRLVLPELQDNLPELERRLVKELSNVEWQIFNRVATCERNRRLVDGVELFALNRWRQWLNDCLRDVFGVFETTKSVEF